MGATGTGGERTSGLNWRPVSRTEYRQATTPRNPIVDRRGSARTEAEYRQAVADFSRQRAERDREERRRGRGRSSRSTSRRRG